MNPRPSHSDACPTHVSVISDLNSAGWDLHEHATLTDGVWIPTLRHNTPVSYPDAFRDRMAALEDTSIWFQSRNLLIASAINWHTSTPNLVEVGAGNGAVASYLQANGIDAVAVEPGIAGAAHAAARGLEVSIAGHLEDLALPDRAVRAIGLFDVIEHLEHPAELMGEVHRVLRPGGYCVLTVPAFGALWSQADEHAGHFRRYSRRSLDTELVPCGFERSFSSYSFASAIPFLFALRTWPYRRGRRLTDREMAQSLEEELAGHGVLAASVGLAAARFEAWWLRHGSLPFGTSIIAVYRKPVAALRASVGGKR